MLLPIADESTGRTTTAIVNYLLIAVNIFVFVFLQNFGANEKFTYAYSAVPEKIITGRDLGAPNRSFLHPFTRRRMQVPGAQPTPIPAYLTLITSMFLHGGIAHILGNMLFLWVFGGNVEGRLGHFRYLLFYLICGVIAGLAHVFSTGLLATDPSSLLIPSLGASGAISGVLGAYILLFPTRRVTVFVWCFLAQVPAFVVIGLWFVFQLINALGVLGSGSQAGGIAYAAHIGGFIAGLVLIKVFEIGRPAPRSY